MAINAIYSPSVRARKKYLHRHPINVSKVRIRNQSRLGAFRRLVAVPALAIRSRGPMADWRL